MVSSVVLSILCASFYSGNTYQIIEHDTLIYDWDKYHNASYYCHFASAKTIQSIGHQSACFNKNKGMVHILANGTKTFPYIAQGSPAGFMLKCGDIPIGELQPGCTRNVHSTCSYTCGGSDHIKTIKCNLVGPWKNVTAQWSGQEPCSAPVVTSLNDEGTSDHTEITYIAVITPAVAMFVLIIFLTWKCKLYKRCRRRSNLEQDVPLDTISSEDVRNTNSSSEDVKISQLQPLIENVDQQNNNETDPPQDANPETPETDNDETVPPHAANRELAIAELQHSSRYDSGYNRENMNKPKEFIDNKDLVSALLKIQSMHTESLENIGVEPKSDTDKFNNTSKSEKLATACPSACNSPVSLLNQQTNSYRRKLRGELEVIPGRRREQTLVGYVEDNAQQLGYTPSQIKMLEMTYEQGVDVKVSDRFLQKLAEVEIKLGSIVQYFYIHGNSKAIEVILEVHRGCEFCEQFRSS